MESFNSIVLCHSLTFYQEQKHEINVHILAYGGEC